MRIAGNAGGSAHEAMTCSMPRRSARLSKYRIALERTWTAPTVSRIAGFSRSSTSSESVRRSGSVL